MTAPTIYHLRNESRIEVFTGTISPAPGGGSRPGIVLAKVNGLIKDFDPDGGIDDASAILIDPRAQPWAPGRVYSIDEIGSLGTGVGAYAHPTSDDSIQYRACYAMHGISGSTEPAWSTDGSTNVEDGEEIEWAPLPIGSWAATSALTGWVVGDGFLFVSDAGGNSGGSEPDWSSGPNLLDTVIDGGITWVNEGPIATWQADHEYAFRVSADGFGNSGEGVIPTVPGDYIFTLAYVHKGFVAAGDTEPSGWADGRQNATDGEILWQLTSDANARAVLTGIAAPAAIFLISVVCIDPDEGSRVVKLIDNANVNGSYGSYAESDVANQFAHDGSEDVEIDYQRFEQVIYIDEKWKSLTPAGQ